MPLLAVRSRNFSFAILLCLAFLALSIALPAYAKSKSGAAKEEVTAVLQKQADAWNRGDLDAFMSAYLQSPDTSYTSAGTEVWGYEALHDRYEKKYGKSRETMGKLSFKDLKAFDLGPKNELLIGHWHLELASSTIDGTFSLVMLKTKDGWKIIHDHSSSIPEKKN